MISMILVGIEYHNRRNFRKALKSLDHSIIMLYITIILWRVLNVLADMYLIEEMRVKNHELSHFGQWLSFIAEDDQETAKSMVSCLKVVGLKCIYVKAIDDIKGLFELRSKKTGVRVYFFIDENKAIILHGTMKSYTKSDILIQRNDIQKAGRLMAEYFNAKRFYYE